MRHRRTLGAALSTCVERCMQLWRSESQSHGQATPASFGSLLSVPSYASAGGGAAGRAQRLPAAAGRPDVLQLLGAHCVQHPPPVCAEGGGPAFLCTARHVHCQLSPSLQSTAALLLFPAYVSDMRSLNVAACGDGAAPILHREQLAVGQVSVQQHGHVRDPR